MPTPVPPLRPGVRPPKLKLAAENTFANWLVLVLLNPEKPEADLVRSPHHAYASSLRVYMGINLASIAVLVPIAGPPVTVTTV